MEETWPKLVFEFGFGPREEFEAKARGYLHHVLVELPDHSKYRVVFYDNVRLTQDLEEESRQGRPFVAEPGMIVVPEVTREHMLFAVAQLYKAGYFTQLVATHI